VGVDNIVHKNILCISLVTLVNTMNNNVVQQIVSNFKRSDEFKRLGNDWFLPRDAMQKRGLYAVMRCLSVCPSVCLSRSWIMSKRVNTSSKFFQQRV